MNTVDIYAEALRSLCEREGGPDGVAATTGLSAANLKQILAGTLLPSGNPRGVGPSVRKRLSEIYPNWMTPESLVSTGSVGGGLSVANTSPGPDIRGVYPLLSKVQAGAWSGLCEQFQQHQAQDWLPSTKNLGKCGYMLRVEGKSMENASGRPNFAEGMVLHVNPDLEPEPGQYVVVRRNATQEATFKRYVLIDGEKYLEAINPDWPKDMKYLPLQSGDEWCGVVVDASLGGLI